MRHLTIITTGGTIEKTYDERTGVLDNRATIIRRMLRRLRLEHTSINIIELLSKDSLMLTDADRRRIVDVVKATGAANAADRPVADGIVILHGTDTLEKTGALLLSEIPEPRMPIVLTGAMRPFEMVRSDALQNLTEALFGAGVLSPGVWCVAHGRALQFPGVRKDRDAGTFVHDDQSAP